MTYEVCGMVDKLAEDELSNGTEDKTVERGQKLAEQYELTDYILIHDNFTPNHPLPTTDENEPE